VSERIKDLGHDSPGRRIEGDGFRCRLLFEAIQPVKDFHQHIQCVLLAGFHRFVHFCPPRLHFWDIPEPEVLPLERDGVVEEELGGVFENIRESIRGEVLVQRVCYVGEHEGNVVGHGVG